MKPSARRRVEREIQDLMKADGDACSLCKAPFPHNSRTFGGVTGGGVPALVGDCCQSKLREVVLSGVYVHNDYQGLRFSTPGERESPPLSAVQVSNAVDALQQTFRAIDKKADTIKAKGGIAGRQARLNTEDSAWKDDDARWFKANGARSHRLRAVFPSELEGMPHANNPLPAGHEYQMLVRQVEPGVRVRLPFCRNVGVPIPDNEALIHAIFDVVAASEGGVVGSALVAELAMRYASTGDAGPS